MVAETWNNSFKPYFASYSLQENWVRNNLLSSYIHKSNAIYEKFLRMPSKGEYTIAVSSIGLKTEENSFLLLV